MRDKLINLLGELVNALFKAILKLIMLFFIAIAIIVPIVMVNMILSLGDQHSAFIGLIMLAILIVVMIKAKKEIYKDYDDKKEK